MSYFAELTTNFGHQVATLGSIAVYAITGFLIMLGCAMIGNYIFRLDLHKELVKDQNVAVGIMLAGLFVAIAVIVAACISS